MQLSKLERYYKTQSKFYDATRVFFLFGYKEAVELLDVRGDDKVIDFACGTGLTMPFLLKKTSPDRIIGIDYSKSMLQQAKNKFSNINFIQGDISTYRFPEKADKIICAYSLSIIDDWKNAIINMKETLDDNGALVILDFHPWQGVLRIFYPIFKWYAEKHGTDLEKEVIPFLKAYFNYVEKKVLCSGYYYIAIARLPKLNITHSD